METAILVGTLLLGIVALVIQRRRLEERLERAWRDNAMIQAALNRCRREQMRRKPEDYPPGTISVEVAVAVNEAWKKAGYHNLGDTRRVVRLLSIAHRVMCEGAPGSLAPAHFNDGDRCPPASVACRAGAHGCAFPDCDCPAIEPPLPPPFPKPAKKG